MAVFLSRAFALSQEANAAPAVNAGADQTITLPAAASLVGGRDRRRAAGPAGGADVRVEQAVGAGDGDASAAATDVATSASFSAAGVYVLRLTVSDGALSASDDVQVTVNAAPVNQAPVVNAGNDQTITLPASASLSGGATDDGLPNPPGSLTFAWSKLSGPGTVTFGNAALAVTTASFSVDGVYVLRLTVSDGALSASDDVQVTVQPAGIAACAHRAAGRPDGGDEPRARAPSSSTPAPTRCRPAWRRARSTPGASRCCAAA